MKNDLCQFDADSLRCGRCGYLARRLPTHRVCRTLWEMAEQTARAQAERRIAVPPLRIGSALSAGLSFVGITAERVSRLAGGDCGCQQRANNLDAVGAVISGAVERAANGVANAVAPFPVSDEDIAAIADAMAHNPSTNRGLLEPVSAAG
jgi:NAD dependent epimerase/dehydratase family enzyme